MTQPFEENVIDEFLAPFVFYKILLAVCKNQCFEEFVFFFTAHLKSKTNSLTAILKIKKPDNPKINL